MTAMELVNSMANSPDNGGIAPTPTLSTLTPSVSVSASTQPSLVASPKSTLSSISRSQAHDGGGRRRIFDLFSSSKSQPPPPRISLTHANSCSAIPTQRSSLSKNKSKIKNKSKRKRKHKRNATELDNTCTVSDTAALSPAAMSLSSSPKFEHNDNTTDSSHARKRKSSKLKLILSGLFTKKSSSSVESSKRPQRSLSFSTLKRKQTHKSKRKQRNKRRQEEAETETADIGKAKTSKWRKRKKQHKKVNKIRKLNEKNAARPSSARHAKTNSCETLSAIHTEWSTNDDVVVVRKATVPCMKITSIPRGTKMNNSHSFTLHGIEEQKELPPELHLSEHDEDELELSSLSDTQEYKDDNDDIDAFADLPLKPALRPKSSSFMRAYEKRPEYTTYYAPASLQSVLNNIPMDEDPQHALPMDVRLSMGKKQSSVDQLFERVSITGALPLDYGNFYGHHDHETSEFDPSQDFDHDDEDDKLMIHNLCTVDNVETPQHDDEYELNEPNMDVSVNSALSSLPDEEEFDELDNEAECQRWV